MKTKKIIFAFILTAGFFGFFSCATLRTPRYEVCFDGAENAVSAHKGLPKKVKNKGASDYKAKKPASAGFMRIVQISDFHSGDFGENEEKLVSKVLAARPDLIVLTGDIFDFQQKREKPVENVRKLLEGIKDCCPIFYVSGNHEYYYFHQNEFSYVLEEYGVKYLKDEAAVVTVSMSTGDEAGTVFDEGYAGSVVIAGVQDPFVNMSLSERISGTDNKTEYFDRVKKTAMAAEKLKAETENVFFTVFLAHRPEYIEEYRKYNVFDLILSGHAHGGQWRFLPFPNGWYAPGQGFAPKFAGGRYDFKKNSDSEAADGKQVFIVSRGLSNYGVSMPRIFDGFELVVIDCRVRLGADW